MITFDFGGGGEEGGKKFQNIDNLIVYKWPLTTNKQTKKILLKL